MASKRNKKSFKEKYFGIKTSGKRKATRKPGRDDQQVMDEMPILGDDFEIISDSRNLNRQPPRKKKKKRTWLKVLISCFLIGVITSCIVFGAFAFYLFAFIAPQAEENLKDVDLNNLKLAYTSIMYATDDNGQEVEIARLHDEENRLWVDLKDMPDYLQDAFISAEDKRFETHAGVDWKRTFSAFVNLIFNIYDTQQGGSTITQQLVKNITDDNETTVSRKMREIMAARYLESKYDKDVILECYLNVIHLGPGVDGVEVAANYYFDKHSSDLTLTQAACLAAITKDPTGYNPYNYPEENENRRNWVLSEMYDNGYITKEEYEKAVDADLGLREKPSTVLSEDDTNTEEYNSYFVDAVIDDVIAGLMEEKNYSKEYATSQLYQGGYKIYTTVDLDIQNKLEEVFTDDDNFLKVHTESGNKPQAAMTVMDYEGHIVGVVGGRGEKTGNRVLNRAYSSRQTGSAIKPVTVYAPALQYDLITWASKRVDGPISRLESGEYVGSWPVNQNGYYSGTTTVLRALQLSLNTVPVKLVQEMGIDRSFEFATEKMGLTTLVDEAEVNGRVLTDKTESSLALGGSVYGTNTTLLTAAYATFGNLGTYYEPTTYTQVLDQYNNVVLDTTVDHSHRAMSESTANIMCEMLQTVTTSGTATSAQFDGWEIMSKTGTTSDTKDRWFVGGTPYYVAAVWFGMDDNEEMGYMSSNPALRLWKAAMQDIHEGLEKKSFPDSDDVEYRAYCTDSGMVANTGCYNVSYGYFKKSYQPTCTYHSGEKRDAATKPGSTSSRDDDSGSSNQNNRDDDDSGGNPRTTTTQAAASTTVNEQDKTTTTAAEVPETTIPEVDETTQPTAAPPSSQTTPEQTAQPENSE